jgi:integrase
MVYLRGNVYWYKIRMTLTETDGERRKHTVRRSAYTSLKREAKDLEHEHRKALRRGEVHPRDPWPPAARPQAPTLKDFSKEFLEFARQHTKSDTVVFYESCLNRSLVYRPLSEVPMSDVTGGLITKYISFRQRMPSGNSIDTLNGEMRTLRRAFRLAEEWGLIPKAPKIHELPGNVIRERVISFEEEARYLSAASPNLQDIATLSADTGLRPDSELFPLQWANVRLGPSPEGPDGYLWVQFGKTGAARRCVPLTPRGRAILERRRRSAKVASWYVFPGKGRTGHIVTVQKMHARALKNGKIEPFEFYCWRHTCGTRWAEAGLDRYTIARLMGHSSPSVAEKYYIRVTEPHVAGGFERFLGYLDRALKKKTAKQEASP